LDGNVHPVLIVVVDLLGGRNSIKASYPEAVLLGSIGAWCISI
jgi:hypothetical protein